MLQVDEEDRHLLDEYTWWPHRERNGIYWMSKRDKRQIALHRLITNAPPGLVVDHINGDTEDNRRANLRVCTRAENSRGQHARRGRSRFKGVYFHTSVGRWAANIRSDRKLWYLGLFDSEEDAAAAYNNAARRLHGEFAVLNDLAA